VSTSAAAPLVEGLVDDAAIFPPGNADLPDAVAAHVRHRQEWYGSLVGPFVVSDQRVPELSRTVQAYDGIDALGCAVVVTGGAGALEGVLGKAAGDPRLHVRGVEIALRDEGDLARNGRRIMTVLRSCLPDDIAVSVELPWPAGGDAWSAAADVVAEYGHRLKFRTGGETPEGHPEAGALATAITAAIDREVAFKCTAGLHHAVRNTDPGAGFEQHGFLNVILATRAVLDGADRREAERLLEQRDAEAVANACADLDDDCAARVRRWFVSFGSCSVADPVADLVGLGLLNRAAMQAAR